MQFSVVILYVDGSSSDVMEIKDTMRNIKSALLKRGHTVKTVKVNNRNWKQAIKTPGQIFFNLVEDEGWSLYKKVAHGLHDLGKAQVAHDINLFSFAIDKAALKRRLVNLGISTPRFRVFSSGEKYLHHIRRMDYPLIIKPAGEHAGIGISQDSVVIDEKEADERIDYILKYFKGKVLVEEFIDGREITVTIIGNGKKAIVMPLAELVYGGEFNYNWPIYSYNAKWKKDTWEYWNVKIDCPAKISGELKNKISDMALKTFRKLKIKDVVRIDMRIDDKNNKSYILDVNISPSLSSDEGEGTYCSARAYGWSYEDMIENIVTTTYERVYGKIRT